MAINQIRRSRKARLGQLALASALAAIITGGGVAGAQTTVDVTGGVVTGPYTNLGTAITTIQGDASADKDITITINADQTAPGPVLDTPYMQLDSTTGNLANVTINGNNQTLTGANAPGGGVLLAIEDVVDAVGTTPGEVKIENLTIKDGYSDGTYGAPTNRSGGGLYVGHTVDGKEFGALTMTNVVFDDNDVALTAGAAIGGGLSVNNISTTGVANGTANLDQVDFTGNSVTMSQGGAATGDSAIGGAARILGLDTFNYTGKYTVDIITGNPIIIHSQITNNSATVENDSHAHGGGLAIEGSTNINLTALNFSGNTATINNSTQGAAGMALNEAMARGGAVFVNNTDSTPAQQSKLAVKDSIFSNNQTVAQGNAGVLTAAEGGAVSLLGNSTGTFTNTSFSQNIADASNGGSARGGAIASSDLQNATAFLTPVEVGEVTLTGSSFYGNQAKAGSGEAQGGAVYMGNGGKVEISSATGASTLFSGNKATATAAGAQAKGGAIYLAGGALTVESGIFGNYSSTPGNTATSAAGNAMGGALYQEAGSTTFTGGLFTGNTAEVTGASTSSARGGAIYQQAGTMEIENYARFEDNKAKATNGTAAGGALYSQGGNVTIKGNTAFSSNAASSSNGAALGGALYLSTGNHSITNSNFTSNTATSSSGTAQGGAIYLDTTAGAANLDLEVTSGTMRFTGNKAGGASSGIHVGSTGGTSAANAAINVDTALNTEMNMDDALSVAMNGGRNFSFAKNGNGTLRINNLSNVSTTAGGTATFDYTEGTTSIEKDYTMVAGAGSNIQIKYGNNATGSTIKLDTLRDKDLAVYDASGAANNTFGFTVGTGGGGTELTTIEVSDTTLHILDFTDRYLYVENGNGGQATSLNGFNFSEHLTDSEFVHETDNNVYLDVNYTSPYNSAIKKAGANTNSAIKSLDKLMPELTFEERKAIVANFDTVTPESALAAGPMAMTNTQNLARKALKTGVVQDHHSNQFTPTQAQPGYGGPNEGARVFGGYFGNFRNVDGDKGYFGYDQEAHGAIIGASYDFGYANSIGVYAGVTDSNLDMDRIKAKTDSDGVHVGAMARFSPDGNFDPNYSIYLDAGYAAYSNDATRKLGGHKATGSFDQDAFTIGAAVEYVNHLDDQTKVTPGLELRYTSLDQDGFREKGLTATKVDGYSVDSFTSILSVGLEHEINLASGGILTPSARIGWQHEYGDIDYDTKAKYQNPNGGYIPGKFKLSTVSTDRDSFDGGVGLRAVFNSGSYHEVGLNLNYDVNVSENSNTHSVYGGLDYRF